jgi:hypothetical protein
VSLLQPPRLPEVAPSDRITPPRLTIAVVDALAGAPLAAHLVAALGARAVRTKLVVRNKPGHDPVAGGVATHPDALLDAAHALLASLPEHDVLVAEGPALLASLHVRLAILGTPSPSLTTLDPDVRALRDRFDLVVHDFRSRTIDLLAAALHGPPSR